MRNVELQSQLDNIERQLRTLSSQSPSEIWVLVPILTAPCPPESLVRSWLNETGIFEPSGIPVFIHPSRHQVMTLLVLTPGFDGEISAPGWHLVSTESPLPVRSHNPGDTLTAWYHTLLTKRFHEFLTNRKCSATRDAT